MNMIRLTQDTVSSVKVYNQHISDVFRNGLPKDKYKFLQFINTTIQIARNLKDREGLAEASYNLGKYYISTNSGLAEATPYLLESLSTYEELNDSVGVSKCYMQIGLISYMTQYYVDAIKNFNLSLKYNDNPTSTYLMAISYAELKSFDESKKYFSLAIDDFTKRGNSRGLNECYMYLGKLYEEQGLLDSAFYYLNMAMKNLEDRGNDKDLTRPYALIARAYIKSNELDKALFYAQKSYDNSKNGYDAISALLSSESLSQIYEKKGDYKKAVNYLKLHHTLQNQNVQGNTKQKIAEIQSTFDFNKKMNSEQLKHQAELHRKNRVKNAYLASGLLVLILAGGLWSRLNYIRKSRAAIRNEKIISEKLLLNILPEDVANELKQKGYSDTKEFEQATIFFTDFEGFTSMSERLTAAELVDELNVCFRAFDNIVEKYHIEKIKTIGDAYMAAGGLPIPSDDSVKNTVLAALEMQAFISERKLENHSNGKPAFEMRVGIHTGPVVAGIVGVKKFQYDIWGDTVNTASRMESHGEIGQVNISQCTYEFIKNEQEFVFINRGKIDAKGKGKMDMWFVQYAERPI